MVLGMRHATRSTKQRGAPGPTAARSVWHIYIYIYVCIYTSLSFFFFLSLSLSQYIYIYIHIYTLYMYTHLSLYIYIYIYYYYYYYYYIYIYIYIYRVPNNVWSWGTILGGATRRRVVSPVVIPKLHFGSCANSTAGGRLVCIPYYLAHGHMHMSGCLRAGGISTYATMMIFPLIEDISFIFKDFHSSMMTFPLFINGISVDFNDHPLITMIFPSIIRIFPLISSSPRPSAPGRITCRSQRLGLNRKMAV